MICARTGCTNEFETLRGRKPRKYCSARCQARSWYIRTRQIERPEIQKRCKNPRCEREFNTKSILKKYCCPRCKSAVYNASSYSRNRDKILLSVSIWSENNKARKLLTTLEWRKKNVEAVRMHNAERRARKRGATVERFVNDEIWERDRGVCRSCGVVCTREVPYRRLKSDGQIDHIIPLGPGSHSRNNCQLLCRSCNSKKISQDRKKLKEWRSSSR